MYCNGHRKRRSKNNINHTVPVTLTLNQMYTVFEPVKYAGPWSIENKRISDTSLDEAHIIIDWL